MFNNIEIKDLILLAKKKVIPISALIEVCYTCNENCIHCCLENHKKQGLTLKEYDNLFDQLVEAETFFVILTGGEPFTRPDFLEIVNAARKRKLSVTIFTNGTLLNPNIIKQLKLLYVHEIHISIYSTKPEIHDCVTQKNSSFIKSISSIKELRKNNINVKIKSPLMSLTVSNKDELIKLAKSLDTSIQFNTVITAKNNGDKSAFNLRLTKKELKNVLLDPKVNPQSKQTTCFKDNLNCIPCETVFNGGSIDPDGNVYVCNQLKIKGGNALKNSFKDIWEKSENFQELRNIRLKHLYKCKDCNLFSFCTRCPGLALLEDNDLYGCSSVAKIVAETRKELNIYPSESHIFSRI